MTLGRVPLGIKGLNHRRIGERIIVLQHLNRYPQTIALCFNSPKRQWTGLLKSRFRSLVENDFGFLIRSFLTCMTKRKQIHYGDIETFHFY